MVPFKRVILLGAILFACQTGLCPLMAQDSIPDSPAGQCLSGLLDAVNNENEDARLAFLKDGFANNDEATLQERQRQTEQVRTTLGQFAFRKTVQSTNDRLSVVCGTSSGPDVLLTIEVTDETPARIESVHLEMMDNGTDEASPNEPLDQATRRDIISRLTSELRSKYVFPRVGETMAEAVESSLSAGEYDGVEDVGKFASILTDQLRDICHDKHLRVRAGTPRRPSGSPGRRAIDNHGFVKAEVLPGGIGYLKFNFFSGDRKAQETAAAAMNFLANSKALIFDLRENGGGSPEMIAFLSSYLFDEPVHLNSFYNRPTDTTTESWTQEEVPGRKFGENTPVFVLTSDYTFSGAEEFSYNLKHLKRGTIVGETTGGGAHPVMPVSLGSRMHMTMPFARAINPVTETNWEGTGVKPDVAVASDKALEKAVQLAGEASRTVAASENSGSSGSGIPEPKLEDLLQEIEDLMASQSFEEAARVCARVTRRDPENGTVWFRYGYCLHASGQLDKAIEIHRKAAGFDGLEAISTYNLACAWALKNESKLALDSLEKAIELGFDDANQLRHDSDFDNVRDNERFGVLLEKLK